MKICIDNEAMRHHMKDILEYRTMEYYRRRYERQIQKESNMQEGHRNK